MNKFLLIVILIFIIALIAFVSGDWMKAPVQDTAKLQMCPDEMIINNMPGPGEKKASYYIVNGERKEITEYDAMWVAANCNVPTQAVY